MKFLHCFTWDLHREDDEVWAGELDCKLYERPGLEAGDQWHKVYLDASN